MDSSPPGEIDEKNPALDFWREITTVFDETRFLKGEIGKFAVVARRVGDKWFIGGLNAGEKRSFDIPLDFVGKGPFKVQLFRDANPDDARSCAPVAAETLNASSITVTCASNGGFAAIVGEM